MPTPTSSIMVRREHRQPSDCFRRRIERLEALRQRPVAAVRRRRTQTAWNVVAAEATAQETPPLARLEGTRARRKWPRAIRLQASVAPVATRTAPGQAQEQREVGAARKGS
jgi:hypothetical protein